MLFARNFVLMAVQLASSLVVMLIHHGAFCDGARTMTLSTEVNMRVDKLDGAGEMSAKIAKISSWWNAEVQSIEELQSVARSKQGLVLSTFDWVLVMLSFFIVCLCFYLYRRENGSTKAEEEQVHGLNEDNGPSPDDRYHFGKAVIFSALPFVFNATSKVITKEIASAATPVDYSWMGWTVPAGTIFKFPIFLATVQFLSNAVMSMVTYKVTVGGSFWEEMKKAWQVGMQMTAQLTITKAASSIGAKTGLMGMPLSLYVVARSLVIPCTQLCRMVVLKKSLRQKIVLSTVLVFFWRLDVFICPDPDWQNS